jgi:hypothetical protein
MAIDIEFDEADTDTDTEIEFDSPVKQSLNYGLTKQPDQHSRIVSLADRERLPVDMVERNLPDLQARENRANLKIDQIEFDTPVAARALADPDTAAMSHDDLDNLTALERIYRKQESNTLAARHVRAVKRGTVGVGVAGEAIASYLDKAISGIGRMFLPKPRGISDAEWEKKQEKLNLTRGFGGLITASKAFGEIAPDEKIQEFSRLVDEASEKQGTATAIFKGVGYLAQNPSVLSVLLAEQAAPMVLAAPIAPITGMMAKPLIAKIASEAARRYAERTVLMAGIQFSSNMANMYGQEIAQGINDGMTVDKALVRARTKSIAESGANAMFAFIPVGGGRVAQVSKETIKQGVAGATGAAVGSFAVGEDITLSEMMLEFFGEMTTAPADIALAAHSSQLDKRHEANIKEQTTLLTSNIDQMKLDEMVNVAKANKLGDRNSERFGKFMQSVVEQYGEDAQVFIDGDQVADIIADMDADLPGVQEMQRQLDQGGDIAIPLESYIADISRSSAGEQIRPHVRLDVDGLSQVELEEAVPQMEQRIKELMEKAELDAAETTRIDEITDQIFTQLMETGRVSTQIAKMSSQIIPAYIATKANEYGLTVDAMHEKLGFGGIKGPVGAVVVDADQQRVDQRTARGKELVDQVEILDKQRSELNSQLQEAVDAADDALVEQIGEQIDAIDEQRAPLNKELSDIKAEVAAEAAAVEPGEQLSQEPAFIEAPFLFVQARDKFLDTLAEDAESEEVLEAAEGFGPEYRNFIKALERDDWLGFDFPSQAIDAALSEEFENFDPSPGLKSAMGRMVNAEAATGRVFEQAGVEADTDTDAFKVWAGGDDVEIIDSEDVNDHDFRDGKPVVLRVFHGTTHKFSVFDALRGNLEGQFGAVNYFTSSEQDATDNYAGEGPDLTNRITKRAEQLQNEIEDDPEAFDLDEDADAEAIEAKAESVARDELAGGEEQAMELFVKVEKPFVIGEDAEWIEFVDNEAVQTESVERVAEANDIEVSEVESNLDDYEDEIDEARWEIQEETPNALVEAIQEVSDRHGVDASELAGSVYELGEEATPGAIENLLRTSEDYAYAEGEEGELIGSQMISEVIQEMGFDSIILNNAESRFETMEMEQGTAHVHIFDSGKTNIKSVLNIGAFDPTDPDIFMQPQQEPAKNGKRPPRATFDIDDRVITLLEQSDPTSFIHESGHLFLEMEKQLSAEFGVTDRQQAMLDWLGVESFDKVKVEHHEKFARGFEAYTFEGKAPSRDLAAVFASFRRWMLEIYKRITRLDVSLTPEVREFFDHMLATDAQIEEVRDNPAYEQFFRDAKSAGMTDAEWTEYQKRQEKSKNKATSTLEQKILKQLKRKYTKEWKAEKKELFNEEMASLGEKPIYQAVKFIQTKDEEGQSRKLNSDAVKEMFDGKIPPKLLTMISKTGTITPDDVALEHGYSSGHEMLTDIIDNPTQKQRAENTVEQRMISKHGDILNDGTIEQEARDAAQNEDKAKVLMIELRALNKQAGATQDIDRAALKAGAERTIAAAKISDIRPSRFYRAEIKAAQKAAAALEAGNLDEARGHKVQQLANHYLYREAVDAEKRVVTMRRYIAGVKTRKLNPKMVDSEYIHQMKILAAAYDFRTGKRSEDEAKAALLNLAGWIEAQMSSDNWIVPQFMDPTLSEMVAIKNNDALESHEKSAAIEQLKIPRYSEMTMEQLRGAYDMIKNLRFVGGRLSKGEAEAFKQLTVETADSIIEHGGKNIPRPQEQSTAFKLISAIKQFGADHVVLGNTIAQMDGYQLFGPMFKAFYQQILDATNVELKLKREIGEKLEVIFGKFKRKDLAKGFTESGNAGHRQITKTNGERWSLSRRGRLILAMYWGSPESRVALMIGNDISETDAIAMIGTLSKKELDFVQNIWDLNEGLWPQVRDTALKMTGVAPPKVEHVPYEVNGRKMPGGYIRLFYDYDARDSYLQDSGENGSLTRSGGHVMKNTRHGSRNERVGSGGRPVSFELDNIFRALDENMHDIAFAETARDGTRFLQSKAIRNAIVLKYGKEVFESLNASMEGIIAGNFASNHPINSLLRYLRTNASYAMLGYSIRNVMQQPVAVTNVFGKIGEKYTLKGMAEFVFNPMKARARVEWIQERSEFMKKRTNLVNRDTSEILNKIGGSLMSGPLKRHAFDLQTMGDAIVAYPAWYGAYLKELDRSGNEKQAITFADESVAQTVGSGVMKDLSPMMQGSGQLKVVGPEMLKSITFMGSYFNKVANLTRDAFKENDLTTVRGGAEFTRQMSWYLMIPAVVSALIVDDLPGEDDDEGWLKWAGEKALEYGLAQIFIIRDLVYLWNGFTPSTPYTRAVTEAGRTVKLTTAIVTGEKELNAEVLAKLTRNVSAFVPLPGAGQAARTIEGAVDASEKNNRNLYQMLVEGKERN